MAIYYTGRSSLFSKLKIIKIVFGVSNKTIFQFINLEFKKEKKVSISPS